MGDAEVGVGDGEVGVGDGEVRVGDGEVGVGDGGGELEAGGLGRDWLDTGDGLTCDRVGDGKVVPTGRVVGRLRAPDR